MLNGPPTCPDLHVLVISTTSLRVTRANSRSSSWLSASVSAVVIGDALKIPSASETGEYNKAPVRRAAEHQARTEGQLISAKSGERYEISSLSRVSSTAGMFPSLGRRRQRPAFPPRHIP